MAMKPIKGAVNRRFRPSSYRKNDSLAKETIIAYLEDNGHTILDSEENYSFDIKSEKNGNIYYSEVEMKNQWKGDWNTSWKEIHIPYRKHKLINKFEEIKEDNTFLNFYVIRGDCKQAWRIKDTLLEKSEVKEAQGFRIEPGEHFFHIPYEEAILVELEDGLRNAS